MTANPWYREPWPWLLMSGPAIVVVAGVVTAGLAVKSFDGMVADDYYKQGLAVNREIARESRARELGIVARLGFEGNHVRLELRGAAPRGLTLELVHPTIPAADQRVELKPASPGVYEGAIAAITGHAYRLRLEDADHRWRVSGAWVTRESSVPLVAR
jgi:hypothetical protein